MIFQDILMGFNWLSSERIHQLRIERSLETGGLLKGEGLHRCSSYVCEGSSCFTEAPGKFVGSVATYVEQNDSSRVTFMVCSGSIRGKKITFETTLKSDEAKGDLPYIYQEGTMRILMLTQFFYPPTVGGEERHVADLSNELAARGHDVSVVTLRQKGYPDFEVSQGIRIHRVRSTVQRMNMLFSESDRPYAPPFPDPGLTRALRRILLEERPDIVHAHNWIVHSFTPLKAWSKAKFVVSLHDYSLVCVQKRLMRYEVPCSGPGLTKCLECGTHFYGVFKGIPSTLANFFWGEARKTGC